MQESHPGRPTPDQAITSTESTPPAYEPDFETLQSLGLKQLALEAARDRLYGEGSVASWAITHVVIPRAHAEAGVTTPPEEQANRQATLFEKNVDDFVNRLTGNSDPSLLPAEESLVAHEVSTTGSPARRLIRGLSDRFRSLVERRNPHDTDTATAHRLLGTTAFNTEQLTSSARSPFDGYATSWDDVFAQLHREYPSAIERDIKAVVGRLFVQSGQIYYGGQGEYVINPLNPPLISELVETIQRTINGNQAPAAQETKTSAFLHTQQASILQQEADEIQQKKNSHSAAPQPKTRASRRKPGKTRR